MVVDDEQPVREVLIDLLSADPRLTGAGWADSGQDAIALASTARPDVVLLDVKLPGGGAAAVRGLLAAAPGCRVLILSAYDDPGIVLEMLSAGASGYLLKGTSGGEIVDGILRCATGEMVVSSEVAAHASPELRTYLDRGEHR